jgi:hypothetical protein
MEIIVFIVKNLGLVWEINLFLEMEDTSQKGKSRERHKIKNLSFDRLDSSKTYFIDNIIFCCTECNLSKKDISIKLIKRLYEIITERNL